jgi:hypothetical protein
MRVEVRNPLDKAEDARIQHRFIPKIESLPINTGNFKYGGPVYIPTNKDYGNFPKFACNYIRQWIRKV